VAPGGHTIPRGPRSPRQQLSGIPRAKLGEGRSLHGRLALGRLALSKPAGTARQMPISTLHLWTQSRDNHSWAEPLKGLLEEVTKEHNERRLLLLSCQPTSTAESLVAFWHLRQPQMPERFSLHYCMSLQSGFGPRPDESFYGSGDYAEIRHEYVRTPARSSHIGRENARYRQGCYNVMELETAL